MQGLSLESLGYLNYLKGVLGQPRGQWDGFYVPLSPSMNFALRYQLAFGAYALAALSQRTPAYKAPYADAMQGAIEKMLDVAAWGYWRSPAPGAETAASSGHVAVLLSPHRTAPSGPPSDPIVRDNLQYSGHLSTMLGLYEKVSGDDRYDSPFTLSDAESGVSYTYTHTRVAERIHDQMVQNPFGGVCCESGMAYVPCNNHALASNALHDALHGTEYSQANARWLDWVRRRMVLRGPAARGVFGAAYAKDFRVAAPVAFNFTDAWGLALMLPFDEGLVRKLYRRFRKKVTRVDSRQAYLDSSPLSEKMEISDAQVNTGFAAIAARGLGDDGLYAALVRYASEAFGAGWDGPLYSLRGAPRTLHATALYALASAIDRRESSMARLFTAPPEVRISVQPHVASISPDDGRVGVSGAVYSPEQGELHISLRQVGSPQVLSDAGALEGIVTLGNCGAPPDVTVDGAAIAASSTGTAGAYRFTVPVPSAGEVTCIARVPASTSG